MAQKGPKRKRRSQTTDRASSIDRLAESPQSVAATIGWMLCVLATLFGIVMSLVTMFVANSMEGGMFAAVSRYLLITACITGVLSVALIPLVRTVRLDRPPAVIERTAVLLAITPWLILGWLFWQAT